MLLSFVLDGGKHNHGLDELSDRMLGHKTIAFKEVAGVGKSQVTFDYVTLDKALSYAAEDADIAMRLHRRLKARLVPEKMATLYETMERPLIGVLTDMEREGIKVNPQILSRMSSEFSQDSARLEDEIYALAGETVQRWLAQADGGNPVWQVGASRWQENRENRRLFDGRRRARRAGSAGPRFARADP